MPACVSTRPSLQLIAPLFAEPLYFLVRADSPLSAVHQAAGARVNVGPADGARAATGDEAWWALFGRPLRPAQRDAAPAGAALRRLAAGDVDLVLLVGTAAARELGTLSPALRDRLRLLPLDRRHPSAAFAARRLRVGTWAPPGPRGLLPRSGTPTPGLAVPLFLATGAAADATAGRAAEALCAALPLLRREGSAAWRQAWPASRPASPWPYAPAASAVLDDCSAARPPQRRPSAAAARGAR